MSKHTLYLGATGNDAVRLLDDNGKDLFDGLPIAAIRLDVAPGMLTTVTLSMHADAVVAEVDPRGVNLPPQGVVAHAVAPSIEIPGAPDMD